MFHHVGDPQAEHGSRGHQRLPVDPNEQGDGPQGRQAGRKGAVQLGRQHGRHATLPPVLVHVEGNLVGEADRAHRSRRRNWRRQSAGSVAAQL